jgi:ubiquinone/menaquinone biosynthesis C-methylase UbiE
MQALMIYDRFAQGYDRLLAPFEAAFLSEWRKELIDVLPSEGPIIEIGAGTGLNFKHYRDTSEIVATDISLEMLRRANHLNSSVKLVQADACRIPFADDTFNAGIGTLILCSVVEPKRVFTELQRVIRDGGPILFLEHVRPDGILGPLFDFLNIATTSLIDDHFNRRTATLLNEFGFEMVSVEKRLAGIVNLIHCRNVK